MNDIMKSRTQVNSLISLQSKNFLFKLLIKYLFIVQIKILRQNKIKILFYKLVNTNNLWFP